MASKNVLVFDSNAYVDSSNGNDAESDNVQAVIKALGHILTTVPNVNNIPSSLVGKQVFVIPELENKSLFPDLDSGERAAITNFVSNGGTLVLMGDGGSNDINLLNGLF